MTSSRRESGVPEDPLERLLQTAHGMRQVLDTVMVASKLPPDPAGTCALASLMLRDAVNKFTPYPAVVRGGAGEFKEGAIDPEGNWHGHYWVEADAGPATGRVILDITADQFGWERVVCAPVGVVGHRYKPGDQSDVDDHMKWTLEWLAQEKDEDAQAA